MDCRLLAEWAVTPLRSDCEMRHCISRRKMDGVCRTDTLCRVTYRHIFITVISNRWIVTSVEVPCVSLIQTSTGSETSQNSPCLAFNKLDWSATFSTSCKSDRTNYKRTIAAPCYRFCYPLPRLFCPTGPNGALAVCSV